MKRYRAPFWEKVTKGAPEECWPWKGYKSPSGHGLTSYEGLPIPAHRKAWILTHGPITSALCVNHRCDNAACCNPEHLYLGTRADNMVDRWAKTPGRERAPGRVSVLTPEQRSELYRRRMAGDSMATCAKELGVHLATVYRAITSERRIRLQKLRADRLSASSRTDL